MAQHTPHTYSTGDTITAALLNQAEADLAAALPKADADAAYDAKGAATAAQAAAVQRANHTGTQSADTLVDGTTNKAYTAAEKTKLAGVATGATAYTDTMAQAANSTALATKVNSSTYTAGLAGKADLVSGTVPDAQIPARLSDASLRTTFDARYAPIGSGGGGSTSVVDNGDGTAVTTSTSVVDHGDGTAAA